VNYLLDTDTCIYIINRKPAAALRRVRAKRPDQVAISTITQAELEYGAARSEFPDRNRIALIQFLFPFLLLPFDQMAAVEYGSIRSVLESKGTPIGPMDLLIAAQAVAAGMTLVTNNEREFGRVQGLRMENWVRA
jgi:tRNA(fMet)-specific endonuclease VapC